MIAASPDSASLAHGSQPTLFALVAHARSVPSAVREALGDRLSRLPERPGWLLIRTCHRVELYAAGDGAGQLLNAELPDLELPAGARRLEDVDAVEHLLSVACGMDSTVFGETQILHQLREAIEDRHGGRALDPVLDRLLQVGLRSGREARSYFTGSPRSLADVALDRIEAASETPVAGREILIVGAGRMARLAAFAAARRHARVVVANRTASRAADLAQDTGGAVVPFESSLPIADLAGAIVAVGGSWPVSASAVAELVANGGVIVDLSSPPALPPTTTDPLGPGFVSVDDLASGGDSGPDERVRGRVEHLISQAGTEYCRWLRARGSVPAIRAVVETAEERRARELEWLRHRLPDLTDEELAVVEQMSHRLVASILHAPLTALTADEGGALEPAARELFGI